MLFFFLIFNTWAALLATVLSDIPILHVS